MYKIKFDYKSCNFNIVRRHWFFFEKVVFSFGTYTQARTKMYELRGH